VKNKSRVLLLLAALTVVVLYIFATGSGEESSTVQDELFSRYRLLAKYRTITEKVQGLDGQSDELLAELAEYENRMLPGTNTALGLAELQKVLGALAEESGLDLHTIKPLPLLERGDYVEVPIQVDLKGTIRGLRKFVEALDGQELAMRTSKLAVVVANVQKPGRLNIRITVHGLMKL